MWVEIMKCIKCGTKNINKANYCKTCGYHFSKEEQKAAKKWSLVWILECIDKGLSVVDLSIITGSIYFKILSIVIVLLIGIHGWFINGLNIKIMESDDYKIQYNTKIKEYYLLTEKDEINLNVYLPKKIDTIYVEHYDKNSNVLNEEKYQDLNKIILDSNSDDDYYILKADNNLKQLKVYVYQELGELNEK